MEARINIQLIDKQTLDKLLSPKRTELIPLEENENHIIDLIKDTFIHYKYKITDYPNDIYKEINEDYLKKKSLKEYVITNTSIDIEQLCKQDIIDTLNDFKRNFKEKFKNFCFTVEENENYFNKKHLVVLRFCYYYNNISDKIEYYFSDCEIYSRDILETIMINKGLTDESISRLLYEEDRFKHIKPVLED